MKSASDFYGKLGALLGKETDVASRRALAQSNFELAELTGKVGRNEDALAAHRAVLAAREALAAEPGAGAVAKVDVGRSLIAVAGLLEATGKTDEALASYRRSESLLAGPAGADPSARAALAACRSQMGWLLRATGKSADALAAFRLARADQEALAAAPEASNDARRDLADTINRIGNLLAVTGKPAEAEAEYRRALAIYQKLADDNPAVTEFRSSLACSHNDLGGCWWNTGKPAEAEAEFRKALAIYQKLADDNPAVTEFRSGLAWSHNNLGWALSNDGQAGGGGGRVPQSAGALPEAGRRQPRRHRLPPRPGGQPLQPRPPVESTWASQSEAEAEYRKAVALYQKLADDNPAVTEFRSGTGAQPHPRRLAAVEYGQAGGGRGRVPQVDGTLAEAGRRRARRHRLPQRPGGRVTAALANLLSNTGKPAEAEAEYRKALASPEAGRRQPRRHRLPQPPGGQPLRPRHPAVGDGQASGGGGRVPQGGGDPAEAGRRQPL